jgi:hypothetical protein
MGPFELIECLPKGRRRPRVLSQSLDEFFYYLLLCRRQALQ